MVKTEIYFTKADLAALHEAVRRTRESVAELVREAVRRVGIPPPGSGPLAPWDGQPRSAPADHDGRRSNGESRRRLKWMSAVLSLLVAGCVSSHLAGRITEANLAQRIASATTAGDHEALAAYFRKKAEEMAAKQVKHERAIINSYKEAAANGDVGPSRTRIREWMRDHCRGLIESYRRVQENYLELADDHAQMARELAAGR